MNKFSKIMFIISVVLLYIFLNFIAYSLSVDLEKLNRVFLLILMILAVSISSFKSIRERDLFQPIMIVNGFLVFIFILRPIFLLKNPSEVIYKSSSVFERYNILYGIYDINTLPFSKALFIGLLGILSIYFGYYVVGKFKLLTKSNRKLVFENIDVYKFDNTNTKKWILVALGVAIIGIILFFAKYNFKLLISTAGRRSLEGISFSVFESYWIYLIPCIIIFIYMQKNNYNKIAIYFITIIYSLLSMAIGRRYIVINILLVIIVLEYYVDLKRKISFKLIALIILAFLAVILYGSIRRNNIGANINSSYFGFILDEFDMFDTLILSLDYKKRFGLELYHGYSYLSTLLRFIPEFIWSNKPTYFDVLHTQVLFQGTIHGGTPTSLIGSLYLNFSYIGIMVGGTLFGYIFSKMYSLLTEKNTAESLGYYVLFVTFIYDIIRVGDIGREFWTLFIYIFVYFGLNFARKKIKI